MTDPSNRRGEPGSLDAPVLLLHGGWGGSWCWTPVLTALVRAGHPVLAPDLIGGGLAAREPRALSTQSAADLATEPSPLDDLTLARYAAPVVATISQLNATYGRVVVVAHSIAGALLHHLGERAPEEIRRLVYLAAVAPAPGRSVAMDTIEPAWADTLFPQLLVADPAVVGALRINPFATDPRYREAMRRCFFNDVAVERAERAMRMLSSENPAALSLQRSELTTDRWGRIPRTWIRTAWDRSIPVSGQDTNVAELDAEFPEHPFEVRTLETGHFPMLSRPADLARWLLEAAAS